MVAEGLQFRKIELLIENLDRLPTLPCIAARLLPQVSSPEPILREVMQVLQCDPALASRTLALANEPTVDGVPPVGTVVKAVERLGLDTVFADMMAPEVYTDPEPDVESLTGFWRHSLGTALASQIVAVRLGDIDPDEALTAGLLHDIGQLALVCILPRSYSQVLAQIELAGLDLIDAERKILGIDHAVVGKRLAGRWGFPEPLVAAIWLHHQRGGPMPHEALTDRLIQVVHLADEMARTGGYRFGPSTIGRAPSNEAGDRLGLSGDEVERLGRQLARSFQYNAEAAGITGFGETEQYYDALVRANRRLGRLNAGATRNELILTRQLERSELLMQAGGALAACHKRREVLETVAGVAQRGLGSETAVAYAIGADLEYVEGVRFGSAGRCEQHFFFEMSADDLGDLLPWEAPGAAVLMRAERTESWLFERMGSSLGRGPFYAVPMISDGAKIGGLVFSKSPSPVDRRSAEELAALAGMGALALKRAQAEANLVRMTEELADVNRRLNQAQDELLQQRSMATVGEMAGGAAHEINNPLAIISGRAQQLLDKEKVKARRDMLESIASSAQRASDIVKELREFARPASPKPLVVAPADIAGGVAEDFAATAAEAQVELKAEVADNVPDIRVDAEQTRTALGEVLRNAVDACRDGGTITLGLEYLESESLVRFHVSDNGTGMDAATLSRAFHPFFCGLEAGRKRGLGLSIAYRLVEANGGKITLDSTPGRGTDVWIMFPLAPAAEAGDAEVKQ